MLGEYGSSTEGPAAIRENFSRILEGMPERPSVPPALAVRPPEPPSFGSGLGMCGLLPEKPSADTAELSLLQMFPAMFFYGNAMLFLVPVCLTLHMSTDKDVRFWGPGLTCKLAYIIPAFFLFSFFTHAQLKRPHKGLVIASLLGPSALFLALGDALTSISSDRADQLQSTDCDTFKDKRRLERSWQAAHDLYMDCLKETVPSNNLTLPTAANLFRVQDCTEYPVAYRHQAEDWDYLRYLEEHHKCAGWCSFGPRLWSFREATDSCSVAVSQVLRVKVKRSAQQVVLYGVSVLLMSVVALIAVGPQLRAAGLGW